MNNQSKPSKPKVGIIGLGRIGQALAGNFVKSGRSFNAADIDTGRLNELSKQWGETGKVKDLLTTIQDSDLLILSIWFEGIGEFLKEYADKLNGKIIIDPSNPIAIDETGTFKKVIAENESSGEAHKALMPQGAKMAKAFCSLSFVSIVTEAFKTPERAALLYANDDRSIDRITEELILDSGFDPVRLGGIDQSIRMEVFGDLNGAAFTESIPTVAELKSRI